jgi:hypothetical protein
MGKFRGIGYDPKVLDRVKFFVDTPRKGLLKFELKIG